MKRSPLTKPTHLSIGIILLTLFVFAAMFATQTPTTLLAKMEGGPAEPVVQFDGSSTITRDEGAGTFQISVVRTDNPAITTTVSVRFETISGMAEANEDFTQTSGTLQFNPSTLTETVNITILDDDDYEGTTDENFYVRLFDPNGLQLGNNDLVEIFIEENDDPPEATPTPDSTIFVDAFEPNDTLGNAYLTAAGASALQNLTLWPVGDIDYFSFTGKAGSGYRISTSNLSAGLDTVLTVYDTQGRELGTNDDVEGAAIGDRRSEVAIIAHVDGFYYARVVNQDPSDPTGKTYNFRVQEVATPTPTPSPTAATRLPFDVCEYNGTIEDACLILPGTPIANLNFVPFIDEPQDTDFFRLPVQAGLEYTCETTNLSDLNDTNIILLDHNGNDFNPPIGNNNKEIEDSATPGAPIIEFGSLVRYVATYTGNLYVVVGPVFVPPYEDTYLYTYTLTCTRGVPSTSTPTPTFTPSPVPVFPTASGGGGNTVPPTSTPTQEVPPTIVFPPTPTPIDFSTLLPPPSPTPPVIDFQPLPTATPPSGGGQDVTVNVTLYYDANQNFTPELTEGIEGMAVALYDNTTGALISFGLTNEAGMLRFPSISSSGAVRIVVPFLNYNQVIIGSNESVLIRIAPQTLPNTIP